MGIIWNRGFWHMTGLHQCLADFASYLRPNLTIVDATRLLLTNGPKGPGELLRQDILIAATDAVAADALATTLFKMSPQDIPYLKIAHQMGLGEIDLNKIEVKRV